MRRCSFPCPWKPSPPQALCRLAALFVTSSSPPALLSSCFAPRSGPWSTLAPWSTLWKPLYREASALPSLRALSLSFAPLSPSSFSSSLCLLFPWDDGGGGDSADAMNPALSSSGEAAGICASGGTCGSFCLCVHPERAHSRSAGTGLVVCGCGWARTLRGRRRSRGVPPVAAAVLPSRKPCMACMCAASGIASTPRMQEDAHHPSPRRRVAAASAPERPQRIPASSQQQSQQRRLMCLVQLADQAVCRHLSAGAWARMEGELRFVGFNSPRRSEEARNCSGTAQCSPSLTHGRSAAPSPPRAALLQRQKVGLARDPSRSSSTSPQRSRGRGTKGQQSGSIGASPSSSTARGRSDIVHERAAASVVRGRAVAPPSPMAAAAWRLRGAAALLMLALAAPAAWAQVTISATGERT